jgi:hypothetical protein
MDIHKPADYDFYFLGRLQCRIQGSAYERCAVCCLAHSRYGRLVSLLFVMHGCAGPLDFPAGGSLGQYFELAFPKSAAQIILRWDILRRGVIPIPSITNKAHITANFTINNFGSARKI